MSDDTYRRLARRLDAIPNGFPATESGVELRLLQRLFTPQEAALASVMRLSWRAADRIAGQAGIPPGEALTCLNDMARRGLIRARKKDGTPKFGLLPFVVGIYEEHLPRMDAEFASLFEQYIQETQGGVTRHTPALHRVIPVEEAIPFELEIFPYERASELVEGAQSWGVRDCICRVQRRLVGQGCDHPVENCLMLSPQPNAYAKSETTRTISKEDALRILREAEQAGLIHSTANHRNGIAYICNCCTCSCGIMRGVTEFNIPTAIARSDFRTVVDSERCVACGDCLERCQFDALSMPDGACVVDAARCVGCGLCASACPEAALHLERRPRGEQPQPPADIKVWMLHRAQSRNIHIFEIL